LWPHAKTHKSGRIARLQLAPGAVGLIVVTIDEARYFAAAGVTDLHEGRASPFEAMGGHLSESFDMD
jgi:D-serine deaminase-like pyridoxal phosphate-dependent protein